MNVDRRRFVGSAAGMAEQQAWRPIGFGRNIRCPIEGLAHL